MQKINPKCTTMLIFALDLHTIQQRGGPLLRIPKGIQYIFNNIQDMWLPPASTEAESLSNSLCSEPRHFHVFQLVLVIQPQLSCPGHPTS